MKFLCVACDEAMKLKETKGPTNGSMTVVFECRSCGWQAAMLTNVMETQMVRSLGVKIGGRSAPAEPMESVRSALARGRGHTPGEESRHASASPGSSESSESKCPFSGMVADAFAKHGDGEIPWTAEAEARIENVPPFAQSMVRQGVEMHAREHGYTEINGTVLDEVKDRFGM